jgi:lipopolysaccharide biosynthesis glycosyltransferase
VIRVFVGFDSHERVAFSVLSHSIHRLASQPVAIAPVMLSQLRATFRRERNPLQSTEFSFSRFLTPWLCDYQGWAIFMDCDMLAREDFARLWSLRDDRYAVQDVKHNHVPLEDRKFLGATQTRYAKKNWSSVMLMNCERCRALTPEFVNAASGLELHQFKWLESEDLIGELPSRWNHLVGHDPPRADAAIVHFTIGGPYFHEYAHCEYADEWREERRLMLAADQREKQAV